MVNRHWTNKIRSFESSQHFHAVKEKVTENLEYAFTVNRNIELPLLLFENISVWIEELQLEMSMIFQLVNWTKEYYTIQKFIIDEDSEFMTNFVHMASVIAQRAFQVLPERIEIINLITGNKHIYEPQMQDLPHSIDFLRMMNQLFLEKALYKKSGSVNECTACPFIDECSNEPVVRIPAFVH